MSPPARIVAVAVAAAVALAGCAGVPSGVPRSSDGPALVAGGPAARHSPQAFLARLEEAAAAQGTVEVIFSGDTVDGSGYVLLGRNPTGNYVFNMGDTNTELVVVDGVAYVKDGAVIGGPWTSMPARGIAIAQIFTPQGVFAAMRAGAESVEDLGPDDLYGTPSTMYELVVHNRGARSRSAVRPALDTSGQPDPPDTACTLWVGAGDLIRRMEVITPGGALILEYGRWGESMEVVAPPPEMVTPASPG